MPISILCALGAIVAAAVFLLNLQHSRFRASLSDEERAAWDKQIKRDRREW